MKKIILLICSSLCLVMLAGCDPAVGFHGKIKADYEPKPLTQGSSANIVIDYLEFSHLKWTNQNVEIIDGHDVVEVTGLTITGLKKGTALVKVEATAYTPVPVLFFIGADSVISTELEIVVE